MRILISNQNLSRHWKNIKKHWEATCILRPVSPTREMIKRNCFRLSQLEARLGIPIIATNDVHYHAPERRELQDVLTCVREKCTIHTAGFRLHLNAERYLKPVEEMQRLFRQYPEAIYRTQEITDACRFSLDELKYLYPEEITSEGRTPMEELVHLTSGRCQRAFRWNDS